MRRGAVLRPYQQIVNHFRVLSGKIQVCLSSTTNRTSLCDMAVDPQDIRSATQALGISPRFQKNIPECPGLADRSEAHPPNGQSGNGQSIEYEGAEPVQFRVLDLYRILHGNNAMLRMVEKEFGNRNIEMMLSW